MFVELGKRNLDGLQLGLPTLGWKISGGLVWGEGGRPGRVGFGAGRKFRISRDMIP